MTTPAPDKKKELADVKGLRIGLITRTFEKITFIFTDLSTLEINIRERPNPNGWMKPTLTMTFEGDEV